MVSKATLALGMMVVVNYFQISRVLCRCGLVKEVFSYYYFKFSIRMH